MDQTAAPNTSTPTTQPAGGQQSGSLIGDLLRTLGVGHAHADEAHQQAQSADVNKQIDQAHNYVTEALQHARTQAANNPGLVLGGLSALVIAAGMLRGRR